MNYVPGFSSYLQRFAEGGQALPTEQPVYAEAAYQDAPGAVTDPVTLAYLKKIGLDQSVIGNLDPQAMKEMAYSARQDAYNTALQAELQRTGELQKIGTMYQDLNPQDYYNTFGTVPINSLGKSRFGVDSSGTGAIDTKEGAEGIKYLTPDQTATYTLYSPRSGQTLGSGTGAEGLVSLAQMASQQTADKDRKADWQLIKTPAEGGSPEVVGSNLYNTNLSTLGKIVAMGIPIATAFIPGLNLVGAMAAGAGAGGLSAAMQEQDILKGALLGGATAGAFNAPVLSNGGTLGGALGNAINKVPVLGDVTRAIGNAIPGAASKAVGNEIVVNAARNITPALVSAGAQAGVQGALNTLTQGPGPRRPDYGDRVEPDTTDDALVVNGVRYPDIVSANMARAAATAALTPGSPGNIARPEDEIVVSKRNEPILPPSVVGTAIGNLAPSLVAPTTPTAPQAEAQKQSTLAQIADYMNLAGMGVGALGSLFGGGNNASQGNRAISGGMGSLNPMFSAKLPGANIPGLGGAAGSAPRTAADLGQQGLSTPQDYYRYGYGPEQSFFNTVPQGAPNTSQAYTGYAEGGFAVTGPGDGREDKIPAMLSDGEYVMDAETVALLGNGSNKAGADMLDQFRVNVRKHKGRELARGGFSADAKRPDQYMAGGRA